MTCDPWPIVWSCAETDGSPEQRDAAQSAARLLLWSRTGRRLGVCTVTELYRPPIAAYDCGHPYMTDDRLWHNGGRSGGVCCAIDLYQAPVQSIEQVKVLGVIQDPVTYRREANRLVRRGTCWPGGLDCYDPPIEVTYRWGVQIVAPDPAAIPPVPASALWGLVAAAMGEVAGEVLKAMCGDVCRLPSRAVSVTRMGVTVNMSDAATTIQQKLLGLELADQLILTVNPGRKQQRSRVYSADMAQRA